MDKIHSDEPEQVVLNPERNSVGGIFKGIQENGLPLCGNSHIAGLSEGAINALKNVPLETEVKIVYIAPGKFEVWA